MPEPPAPTVPPGSRSMRTPSALPVGTKLAEFEIRQVLGVGGFGIVYLAFDHALEREVALKEYMPQTLADRTDTLHVSLRSAGDEETFAMGLRSFVNEARMLAHFDHPSLLKVHRFWEANGTAYMVMPLYRGRTLKEVAVDLGQAPTEAWLRQTLAPLLGALEAMHKEGVFHRDISPDNILVEGDGHPVLLDFGAARRVIADRSQTLTAILKPSYAPIEQYAETTAIRQGPWTDIYALGATLHFMLLGRPPPPATTRAVHDEMPSFARQGVKGFSSAFLATVDWMLAPRPADRPTSIAQVREALDGRLIPPQQPETTVPLPRPVLPPVDPDLANAPTAITRPPVATAATDDGATVLVRARAPEPAPAMPTTTQSRAAAAAAPASDDDEATVIVPARGTPRSTAARSGLPKSAPAAAPGRPLLLGAGVALVAAVALVVVWWALRAPSAPANAAASAPPASAALAASQSAGAVADLPAVAAPASTPPSADSARPAATGAASAEGPRPGPVGAAAPASAATTPRTPPRTTPPSAAAAPGPAQLAPAPAATSPAPRPRAEPADPPPSAAPARPATPAAEPRVAPPAAPATPQAACAHLSFLANHNCMRRTCNTAQWIEHPECSTWRTDRAPQQ